MGGEHAQEPLDKDGVSRRRFVTRSAAAAGAAWVVPSIVTATPAFAQGSLPPIAIPGPNTVEADPPPQATADGDLTSNTVTFYWFESGPTVLGAAQPVNRNGSDGTFSGAGGVSSSIPLGTTVNTYFIHADASTPGTTLTGSLTFSAGYTIVGVSYRVPPLAASSSFEYPGTTYTYAGCESTDSLTISGGSTVFSWVLNNITTVDQIRLFVSPP